MFKGVRSRRRIVASAPLADASLVIALVGRPGLALLQAPQTDAQKKTAHASEQDRPDILKRREDWFESQLDLDPERLVFIDETWTSTNMARTHGRCARGERLRAQSPVKLLIAATRVRDGELRIFRESELSVETVLASACLPLIHRTIEVDGEPYWDGGYSANPPLIPLVQASDAANILVVQVTPARSDRLPETPREIVKRLDQINFNSTLNAEIEVKVGMSVGATPLAEPFWTQDRGRSSQTPAEAAYQLASRSAEPDQKQTLISVVSSAARSL
jgi:predicted acylesterase/phospholipase RssA